MNRIEAAYVPGSGEDRVSGLADVICPACGRRMCETDLGTTQEEGSDRAIEICDDCLIEAEKELGIEIDADILTPGTFQKLWAYFLPIVEARRATEPPQAVTLLARLLGGRVWRSGGGTFLVLIKRADGHLIAITDESVAEYESEAALSEGRAGTSIRLV